MGEQVIEHKAGMETSQGKGEIVWTFTNPGQLDFACLIPGHYELGMKGALTVTAN